MGKPPAIVVVGPTCSGKSEAGRMIQSLGFEWIEPGLVKEYVPLEVPLLERLQRIDQFFEEHGDDAVAREILSRIESRDSRGTPIVVTGCRKPVERDVLRQAFRPRVLALHCSDRTRFARSQARVRADSPSDYETFLRASAWEYAIGLGRLVLEADALVANDQSLSHLRSSLERIVRQMDGQPE